MNDVETDPTQVFRIADARDLEQLRAADRTGRQNDLPRRSRGLRLSVSAKAHPNRPAPLEHHPLRMSMGDNLKVRSVAHWVQEAACRTMPFAVADRALVVGHTFLTRAVIVGVTR